MLKVGCHTLAKTVFILAMLAVPICAHPGALDAMGGHHDRRNGGYHYHRGGPEHRDQPRQVEPRSPRVVARSSGRESPRTTARTEPPSLEERATGLAVPFAADHRATTIDSCRPTSTLAPRYRLRLKNGQSRLIASYEDEPEHYFVQLCTGGRIRYPKRIVMSLETLGLHVVAGLPQEGVVIGVSDDLVLRLTSGQRVRLVGIRAVDNTVAQDPSFVNAEAFKFIKRHVLGQKVEMVYDAANIPTNHQGVTGELLAYVSRHHDGFDLNSELIRCGFALVDDTVSFARYDEFDDCQRAARIGHCGVWALTAK